ncbi:MAG: ABC transporter permease [Saprospiraceae bacterium]|nr:ABC transporter permease [Saprospiraceae bacterium]
MSQNKLGYFLNILGLSIGFAAFMFIFYYVKYELSYDDFHEKADRIYRVALSQTKNGDLIFESAENYPGVGPALKETLPAVEDYTRLYNAGSKNNVIFSNAGEDAKEGYKTTRFLYADSSFFKMFSFPLLKGDRNSCLSKANTVVISESFAKKVFKGGDPIGKLLRMSDDDFNEETCEITGVFKDIPFNAHLKFDVLISYANLLNRGEGALNRYFQSWKEKDMYTYVQLREGTDPQTLEARFPAIVDQYNPELIMINQEDKLSLQPIGAIHLNSHLADEAERNGQKLNIFTLALAGMLILIVAMVNFLNYSIARSMTRAKGFGIQKVFGAEKKDLFAQFAFEAVFLNLLAVLGAVFIVVGCFSFFKDLTQIEGSSLGGFFLNSSFLYAILTAMLSGILFGGILPALVLNRFDLIAIVKGRILNFGKGLALRRTLITIQIFASIALTIICLLVISQINFLTGYDLGIDISNTFVMDRPGTGAKDFRSQRDNFTLFQNKLMNAPGIVSVSGSSLIPGERIRWRTNVHNYGADSKNGHQVDLAAVDDNFLGIIGLDIVAGQPFSKARSMDADTNVIISEKTAKILGFKNPSDAVGKTVTVEDWEWSPVVIGVVEDYHQLSLKESPHPTLFMYTVNLVEYYLVKVTPNNTASALAQIENTWNATFPGNPFQYFYLQDFFYEQYSSERIFARYMLIFAVISILISCIGLFNISLFTMIQRTKEIGVRKSLGASAPQIGWLLIKDYLKLIAIGSLTAFPFAYLFGRQWLDNFVYSVSLNAWYFIASTAIVLAISVVTISYYTIRSTRIDPIQALKNQS